MPTYRYFNFSNSYIQPYSSSIDGGELVTEFNQRAQLNTVGYHLVDLTKEGLGTYESGMTGTKSLEDLSIQIQGSRLILSAGKAVINGYYIELNEEISLTLSDLIPNDEVPQLGEDEYVEKFVKIHLDTTSDPSKRHDERLIPPANVVISGVCVAVDNETPTVNDLLLGTVRRHPLGRYTVWDNPHRARILDITKVAGAENYNNLISAPADDSIYAVKNGPEGNLVNINEWTWLSYNSPLGRYLRNLTKSPDDAGGPGGVAADGSVEMLPTIVGDIKSPRTPQVLRMVDRDPKDRNRPPRIEYQVLKNGNKGADCYDLQTVELPFVNYSMHGEFSEFIDDELQTSIQNGVSGVMKPETLWQVDQLWKDRDSLHLGTQYGPFETLDDALTQLQKIREYKQTGPTASSNWDFSVRDYFWVLSDSVNVVKIDSNGLPVQTNNNITTVFGNVSGTYSATTNGEVTSLMAGKLSGNPESRVMGNTNAEFTWSGTLDEAEIKVGDITTTIPAGTGVTGKNTVSAIFDVSGTLTGNAKGTGSGVFTGEIKSVTQNVSARYVYTHARNADGALLYYALDKYNNPTSTQTTTFTLFPVKEWKKEAVLRGFATPATPEAFGFVKPSTGANFGDVVTDSSTKQLRLSDRDIASLNNVRWTESDATVCLFSATDTYKMLALQGTVFTQPVTIRLIGDGWDANTHVLQRLRGDITIDLTSVRNDVPDQEVLTLRDCSILSIRSSKGLSDNESYNVNYKINVEDCTLRGNNFKNLGRWVASRFDSGSNTAIVNNPWTVVQYPFSTKYENSLLTRFVSVTRGEYEITSAELDVWIKRADWTTPESFEDLVLKSIKTDLMFPPLYLRTDESNDITDVELIPDTVVAKVSGTGGNHRVWDATTGSPIHSGSLITNIDWENGGTLVLAARVLNPSKNTQHGMYDVRFRALVQFTNASDRNPKSVDYNAIFKIPE